jgi:hypothetical protein
VTQPLELPVDIVATELDNEDHPHRLRHTPLPTRFRQNLSRTLSEQNPADDFRTAVIQTLVKAPTEEQVKVLRWAQSSPWHGSGFEGRVRDIVACISPDEWKLVRRSALPRRERVEAGALRTANWDFSTTAHQRPTTPPRTAPHDRGRVLPTDQLRAATSGEFITLLRSIMTNANLTAGQVASRSSIPRSQAYKLVEQGRTTLPTKPDQITEFLRACRLVPDQINTVMALWSSIRQQSAADATPPTPDTDNPEEPPTETDDVITTKSTLPEQWRDRTPRQIVQHGLRRKPGQRLTPIDYPLDQLGRILRTVLCATSVVISSLALMIDGVKTPGVDGVSKLIAGIIFVTIISDSLLNDLKIHRRRTRRRYPDDIPPPRHPDNPRPSV